MEEQLFFDKISSSLAAGDGLNHFSIVRDMLLSQWLHSEHLNPK